MFMLAQVMFVQGKANSAACANVSSYGTVRLSLPELPRKGKYALWVRTQSAFRQSRILLEVNKENCLTLESLDAPANQWFWLTQKDSQGVIIPVNIDNISGNVITLIGIDDAIKVDKVVLTELDCMPQDFGDNCNNIEAMPPDTTSITQLEPYQGIVSGSIKVSKTPDINRGLLQEVRYSTNGRVFQRSEEGAWLDTTLIENGKHTVFIDILLKDGQSIRESIILDVKNPVNAITPVIRWVRISSSSIKFVFILIATIVAIVGMLYLLRSSYKKRRELEFRGF